MLENKISETRILNVPIHQLPILEEITNEMIKGGWQPSGELKIVTIDVRQIACIQQIVKPL